MYREWILFVFLGRENEEDDFGWQVVWGRRRSGSLEERSQLTNTPLEAPCSSTLHCKKGNNKHTVGGNRTLQCQKTQTHHWKHPAQAVEHCNRKKHKTNTPPEMRLGGGTAVHKDNHNSLKYITNNNNNKHTTGGILLIKHYTADLCMWNATSRAKKTSLS